MSSKKSSLSKNLQASRQNRQDGGSLSCDTQTCIAAHRGIIAPCGGVSRTRSIETSPTMIVRYSSASESRSGMISFSPMPLAGGSMRCVARRYRHCDTHSPDQLVQVVVIDP